MLKHPRKTKYGHLTLLSWEPKKRKRGKTMKLRVSISQDETFYFPDLMDPDVSSDYFVTIKEINQGEMAQYQNLAKTVRYIPVENDRFTQEQEFPSGDRMFTRAECCVKDWNLDDEKGNRVPFSRESWNQLPPEWGTFLDEKVMQVNPQFKGEPKNRRKTV